MTLRARIALPHLALIAALIGIVTLLARERVRRLVREDADRALSSTASLFAARVVDLPRLEKDLREKVAPQLGLDVFVQPRQPGETEATTLPPAAAAAFRSLLAAAPPSEGQFPVPVRENVLAREGYLWAAAPRSRAFFLKPLAAVRKAQDEATRPLLAAGLAGIALAVILGALVAAGIASPLKRLSGEALALAGGDLNRPIPETGGGREVESLAEAFRRMVEGLRESQSRLVRAERLAASGHLAGAFAHEIRNPLQAMAMAARMLPTLPPPKQAEALDILRREIARLEGILARLVRALDPPAPDRRPNDLAAVAREAAAVAEAGFAHRGVALECEAAVPVPLDCDKDLLRSAALALLENAADATGPGGRVTIRCRADGPEAVLEVDDTGPGVPERLADSLFEPFVSGKPEGTGLGLFLARNAASAHGGRIAHEPIEPRGTRFRISIPASGTAPAAADAKAGA